MEIPRIMKDETIIFKMAEAIIKETVLYVSENKLKSLVVGVSGGIDSALVSMLAREVCIRLGNRVKLIGRSLPITSKAEEVSRANDIGLSFCDDFETWDLNQLYLSALTSLYHTRPGEGMKNRIRFGNIKARLRMIQLFHLAHEQEGMVLSTDNFTELLLGFWTLHGDVGNYGMIQNLWKTEVYLMAKKLISIWGLSDQAVKAMQACIDAVPTDGLGITNSDLDQFGEEVKTYQDVDEMLYNYLYDEREMNNHLAENLPYVVKMFQNTMFKRNDPTNIPRRVIMQYCY